MLCQRKGPGGHDSASNDSRCPILCPLLCMFLDAGMTNLSKRYGGQRPKGALGTKSREVGYWRSNGRYAI